MTLRRDLASALKKEGLNTTAGADWAKRDRG